MRCLSNDTQSENSTERTPCELFKTKHERNCNQLFHNRLRYLKCPQTHAVFYVCLLLFMDLWKTKQPRAVYLFAVLTRPISCLLVAYLRSVLWCLRSFCIFLIPSPNPFSLHLHPLPCLFISALCLSSGGPVVGVGAVVEMQRDVQHRDPAEAEALQFFGARLG